MKERFDDDRYYGQEEDFNDLEIANFVKVLKSYTYERYVKRFRMMAGQHRLAKSQRPKLSVEEHKTHMDQLWKTIQRVGETNLLDDPKAQKIAERLLVPGLFDELGHQEIQ